jgi:rhomboid family GlyGly-CTERM serine protease
MDASKPQTLPDVVRRLPVVTLLIVGAAVTVALFPGWSSWLVYDRSAIFSGEIWRMFTGHWVHFSMSHLVYDSLSLGIVGWIIETQKLRNFGWLCLLAPWLISGVLLVVEPQMKWFGGLSALATTAMVYLALCGLHDAGMWRWVCLATLLGLAGKLIYEITTGSMLFVTAMNDQVVVSTSSHISGVLIALVFYGGTKIIPGRNRR